MKQSPDFKQLQPMRLLRYARNDTTGDFLRDHQVLILMKYGDSCEEKCLLSTSAPLFGQSMLMRILILQLLYHQPFDIFLSHGKLFV
jgi:hypothetical protein